MRELDDALGLSDLAAAALRDTRRGKNTIHRLDGLFRQSVCGRLAGSEDVNDADRLALDPVMRQVVGGRAVDAQAASASQMGRFETEALALGENRGALADLNGQWIDRFHDRNGLKFIVLDMDSSVSPTHGDQEGSAWNGHFDCTCYHPNFLFNQFGLHKRAATGAHEFDKFCTELGIEHRLTPPKSPQTNGMVERFNGRVEEVLQSHHFRSGEELETTLHRYVWLYN